NVCHCERSCFRAFFVEYFRFFQSMQSPSNSQSEAALHAIDYWQVIKNRYGVILLTLLLVFMTAAVITYVMPKKFESTATIEVKPRGLVLSPFGPNLGEAGGRDKMTP